MAYSKCALIVNAGQAQRGPNAARDQVRQSSSGGPGQLLTNATQRSMLYWLRAGLPAAGYASRPPFIAGLHRERLRTPAAYFQPGPVRLQQEEVVRYPRGG